MKIIDGFLNPNIADHIEETMIGKAAVFPWYYNLQKTDETQEDYPDNYQFTHTFFKNHRIWSDHFNEIITPFIEALNVASLIRIKANLNPRTAKKITDVFHVDYINIKAKTAIYYVNTNDGQTIFKSGKKVTSVKNRLVVFDTKLLHMGTTCTDSKVRCLINFNYMEWATDHANQLRKAL